MQHFLLTKVRLSAYFTVFFCFYALLAFVMPRTKVDGSALTLFSVNSFLYGFYISPILAAQKARVEELHRIVRSEANAIFAMVMQTKDLPAHLRNNLQDMFINYIRKTTRSRAGSGEKAYEELITFCIEYEGKEKSRLTACWIS